MARYIIRAHGVKTIIIFDLDGTLAESKQPIDTDMGELLTDLLDRLAVGVISGGDWPQFEKQLVHRLPSGADLSELFLLPTSGSKFLRFDRKWQEIYAEVLNDAERSDILLALRLAIARLGLDKKKVWGNQIEDRGSQITFSGLGQLAPLSAKRSWDPDLRKRQRLKATLEPLLTAFSIRIGGSTSIDITRRGIDKAYGLAKFGKAADIQAEEMVFVGDALYAGGNDAPVRAAGIDTVAIRDVAETKTVIRTILACFPRFEDLP